MRTYHYQGFRAKVEVYRANGTLDFNWTQKIGNANVSVGIQDANNVQNQLIYENTYRPIQYTNRNNQTFTMARDNWGNPLTLTTPRGIQWQFSYNYPENYPVQPLLSMAITQQGYDGSIRTPTVYEFYQTTDTSYGAVKGLLSRILSPRPGTSGTGEQVETRFYYTAKGNVALISAPGPNNDGRRLTTLFFYTVDPWGGGPFPERQNQPVAVAVYDKTLTLADYTAIPTNPSLRDDRLIFFERYRYDDRGNLVAVQDASGFTTNLSYNASDQLEWITYPQDSLNGVQARERFIYRYVGGPLYAVEVYNGSTLFRSYLSAAGAEGEVNATVVSGTRKTDLGYDAQYRLRSIQGGLNATTGQRHTTEYAYTDQNFPQRTRYPNGDEYNMPTQIKTSHNAPAIQMAMSTPSQNTIMRAIHYGA